MCEKNKQMKKDHARVLKRETEKFQKKLAYEKEKVKEIKNGQVKDL